MSDYAEPKPRLFTYDPRDPDQSIDDPSTWKETGNPALILAALNGKPAESEDWGTIGEWADMCDREAGIASHASQPADVEPAQESLVKTERAPEHLCTCC